MDVHVTHMLTVSKKRSVSRAAVAFVKDTLSEEGTGHDWYHIQRVWKNAREINTIEKGDAFIIILAVLLHDVGDRKVIHKDEDDYTIAYNFLTGQDLSTDIVERVMYIIKHMSFSSSFDSDPQSKSIEFMVVQDADRLDALGAIGVARVFAYGGSRNRPLYDPAVPARNYTSKADYQQKTTSSFHHFYEKVLLLKDLMNTKTAKKIASKRHRFVLSYMEQFLHEWRGER
jgi:uncharacterized protein